MSKLEELCAEYQELLRQADQKALEINREHERRKHWAELWPYKAQNSPQ